MDMSEFDHREHAGILLDGVADVMTLWRHREVLQGRPKPQRGGRSNTMVYSYPYTLAKRAVVATLDLSARNLHMLTTNHWLSRRRNVALLRLTGPSWQVRDPAPVPALSPSEKMRAWSVSDVAMFYSQQDAEAVAEGLRSKSVSGCDLLVFQGWEELARELGVVPFVAKKILRLRDEFLAGNIAMF